MDEKEETRTDLSAGAALHLEVGLHLDLSPAVVDDAELLLLLVALEPPQLLLDAPLLALHLLLHRRPNV